MTQQSHESTPVLSAIMVVGPCRERAERVLRALCAQTIANSIEIIIIDMGADQFPPLATSSRVRTVFLPCLKTESWARARAEGIKCARSPIIAFIEDHCFPAPNWAAVLVETHKGPWAAIGYSFTNANPQTYISRAALIVDYGLWAHPAHRGEAHLLPGNNVSYKRDQLLSFGERLETVLAPDFNIQESFTKRGLPMFVEARALAAHQNFTFLQGLLGANHHYCRVLAANRVQAQSWSQLRRVIYGIAVPVAAPVIKFIRLLRSLRHRPRLWPEVGAALPVIIIVYLWSAIGESFGYLLGVGNADREFNRWEVETERER